MTDLNPMSYFKNEIDSRPPLGLNALRGMLAECGIVIEHTFQLGVIATWSMVPTSFSECLFAENAAIGAALGHPLMTALSDEQVVEWLNEEKKLGWLIRVELLFHPQSREIAEREEGRWFYNARLDQAILAAVAWASTPARPELESA